MSVKPSAPRTAGSPAGTPAGRQGEESIVSRAAAILAEEVQSLAAGRLPGLSAGPAAHAAQLPLEELRDRARTLADSLVRVLGQRPQEVASFLTRAAGGPERSGETAVVQRLKAKNPVRRGGVASVMLRLVNDDSEADECTLLATDLLGASGHRIPATHVRISPHAVRVPASGSVEILVEVRVPSNVRPGRYSGLVQSDDGELLQALVQIIVLA